MEIRNLFRFRESGDGEQKPFLDHLEDLRWMVVKMAVALAVGMVAGFLARVPLTRLLQWPLATIDPTFPSRLQSFGVADPLTISFQLAFYAGIVLAFPFLLYFAAEFVLPALTTRERRVLFPTMAVGIGLFVTGVTFCFLVVLPQTLAYFYQDSRTMGWSPNWSVREYFAFVTQVTLSFGLAFELPVVVLALVRLGLLSRVTLRTSRPYAVILIVIFAAVITPTSDMLTLGLLAVPMLALYEICIWIARFVERKQEEPPAELLP
jgi:sec-independent protein translocase protein TatC